jgi:predicted glycoside hydrolase/deacetylase ChbG (UPF0249 family)
MRIIINADDLGYSDEVNDAIFSQIRAGCVTSSTILANGPRVKQAAHRLGEYKKTSFGVHLNISEFSPLTDPSRLRPVLTPTGVFAGNIRAVALTPTLKSAIFSEWCAQIELIQNLGIKLSHLDSHHHVHTIPELFFVLKRVQRKYGIRKVRRTRDLFAVGEELKPALRQSKALWNYALTHWYRTITTERFASFSTFYQQLQTRDQWPSTVELMCHPGNIGFESETALLGTSWRQRTGEWVDLISYNEL